MKKIRIRGILLFILMIAVMLSAGREVNANDRSENIERDYVKKIYDSANGLDGSSTNCIFATGDGMLWIGGYAGLFRYDGMDFKRIDRDGYNLSVKTLIEDQEGLLWVGTNDDGIYCFDGTKIVSCKIDSEETRAASINKFCLDSKGKLWVGTKAGLFFVDPSKKEPEAIPVTELQDIEIRDMEELTSGDIIFVAKNGKVFCKKETGILELDFENECEGQRIRCCGVVEGDSYYLGTDGNRILKVSNSGKVLRIIDSQSLSSMNDIREWDQGSCWICSDTGIGILTEDQVNVLQMPMDDSIEEVCKDYQGGYWFASSRQGIMQVYKNDFSDLGTYLNNHETINAIQLYSDKMYVGTDQGLYCYRDKVSLEEDALVKACQGERIRQIYLDEEDNLWVATYQSGVLMYDHQDENIHSFSSKNSALSNDQVRCMLQISNQEILVGTERGIFVICRDSTVESLVKNQKFNETRIMDVQEDSQGRIYAATDSDGIYVIEDGKIRRKYTEKDGLPSDSVMKMVPSKQMKGIWVVTGKGICLIDEQGKIFLVSGIPYTNCLDLMTNDQEEVLILAGNGLFRLKERNMLQTENVAYEYWNRKMGLPVDFTANARNTVQDGVAYLCGADGFASIDMKQEKESKDIRLYVNSIMADGKEVFADGKEIILPADTQRISLDVRILHYICQNVTVTSYLEGLEESPNVMDSCENTLQSYNNLKGGRYLYHVQVNDSRTQECLAMLSVPIMKSYHFWEVPRVQILFSVCMILFVGLLIFSFLEYRMKKFARSCEIKFLQEKNEVISRMAYRDLVTDTYNRNLFEEDKKKLDMDQVYAGVILGVNHWDYLRRKYGNRETDRILIKLVQLIRQFSPEDLKIYRCSEYLFSFWFTKSLDLDRYIRDLKTAFMDQVGKGSPEISISVGIAYHEKGVSETLEDLIDRGEKMRLMDEKNAEFSFVEGKIRQLT